MGVTTALLARRILKYVRKNPWTWYAAGGLALVALGAVLFSARGQTVKATSTHQSSSKRQTQEVVLANADLVITATGGTTRVRFDENGVPCEITNEGGKLEVQARITMSRSTSGRLELAESSSSSFESSGPSGSSWEWGVRAGGEYGRDGWTVPIGLERRLFGSVGVEASANVPIEGADILDRTRFGAAIRARF